MKLVIERQGGKGCTLGRLFDPETDFELHTLENPWLDNRVNVSCIRAGEYVCKRIDSPKFEDTFAVTNVEGRTHIVFHAGNWESDTRGCVLLGRESNEQDMIMNSRAAFATFMDYLADTDEFVLDIREAA